MRRAAGSALTALALGGCTLLDVGRMAPGDVGGPARRVPLTVRVLPAAGAEGGVFGGGRMLDNDELTAAVADTLRKAAIFKAVSTTAGDVDLQVTLLYQDQVGSKASAFGTTARMLATYRFTDRAGRVLWHETYDTEHTHVAGSGATRTSLSREGAARENLAAFARGVRERWPAN